MNEAKVERRNRILNRCFHGGLALVLLCGLGVAWWAYLFAGSVQRNAEAAIAIALRPACTASDWCPNDTGPPPAAVPPMSHNELEKLSTGDVVAALAAFYQTIVGLLVGLVALVAVFSALTMKLLTRAAADEIAHSAVVEHLKSSALQEQLRAMLDDLTTERIEYIQEAIERLSTIVDKYFSANKSETVSGTVQPAPESQ